MTTETLTPAALYVIGTIGPYAIPHAYSRAADIVVMVQPLTGAMVTLSPANYTLSPDASDAGGDLTLSTEALALYQNQILIIVRDTLIEQGWVGATAREKGLEAQLDIMVRHAQDNARKLQRAPLLAVAPAAPGLVFPAPDIAPTFLGYDAEGQLTLYPVTVAGTAVDVPFAQYHTGDGQTLQYELTVDPVSAQNCFVYLSGLWQRPGVDFSLVLDAGSPSGRSLLFTVAPNAGLPIAIAGRRPSQSFVSNETDAIIALEARATAIEAENLILAAEIAAAEAGLASKLTSFVTRAALVAAAAGLDSGTIAQAGGQTYIKDGGGTIPDLTGWSPQSLFYAHLDHFRAASTAAGNTTALAAAVSWLNAVDYRTLELPGGSILVNSALPAITGLGKTLKGNMTRLTMDAAAGASGAMLIWGTTAASATRGRMTGIICQFNNTPAQNDFALDLVNAVELTADLWLINAASAVRFGGAVAGDAAQRCNIYVTGNCNKGLNADSNILFRNGSSNIIHGVINGNGVSNTNPTGALIRYRPIVGGVSDTNICKVFMQFFGSSTPGSSDGKPYGVYVDSTDGPVTNLVLDDFQVCDHTTVAAAYFTDGVASTSTMRSVKINCSRFATDAGKGIVFAKQSAAGIVWVGITVLGNHIDVVDNDGLTITGTGYQACVASANSIVDTAPGTPKNRAVLANADGWLIADNQLGPNQTGGSGFVVGVEVSNAAVVDLVVANNQCHPSIVTPIKIPAVWTTAVAPRRVMGAPGVVGHAAYAKASLPDAAHFRDCTIVVTDDVGGRTLALSRGTGWHRVSDNNLIS
jgi:hypothetical protein